MLKNTLNQQSSLKFSGIPIGTSSLKGAAGAIQKVSIVELEPKDTVIIQSLRKQIRTGKIPLKDPKAKGFRARKTILNHALGVAEKILKFKTMPEFNDFSVVYLAVADRKPCGLIIGNMPKMSRANEVVYSNRGAKKETEIDWLVTWETSGLAQIKGLGKALVSHFFKFCQDLNINTIYVRSEIPKKSSAKKFYESMSFRKIKERPIGCESRNRAKEVVNLIFQDKSKADDSPVYAMMTTKATAKTKAEELFKKTETIFPARVSLNPEEFADF